MRKKNQKGNMERMKYIEYLSNQSNEICMNNGNSKTGKACLNLSMPVCTCRIDAPCKATCYACKGTQQIAKVQAAYYRNFRLYTENADEFFEQMYCKIRFSGLPKVRLFDSGDFPNYEFSMMKPVKDNEWLVTMAVIGEVRITSLMENPAGNGYSAKATVMLRAYDIVNNCVMGTFTEDYTMQGATAKEAEALVIQKASMDSAENFSKDTLRYWRRLAKR